MNDITVLVVDDQAVVRAGLRTMLSAEPDIEVIAEAGDGVEAVHRFSEHHPDVVLMDVRMPRLDGISATRSIIAGEPSAAVVIITTFDDEDYLLEGIRAGASGFLLKDAGAELLAAAVRAARRGDSLIDPAMTRSLLEHRLRQHAETAAVDLRPLDALSEREREVLSALARGLSNAEIAAELYVSEATVKSHLSSVLLKTGTRSRVQAAVLAYETGFVRPGWLQGGRA